MPKFSFLSVTVHKVQGITTSQIIVDASAARFTYKGPHLYVIGTRGHCASQCRSLQVGNHTEAQAMLDRVTVRDDLRFYVSKDIALVPADGKRSKWPSTAGRRRYTETSSDSDDSDEFLEENAPKYVSSDDDEFFDPERYVDGEGSDPRGRVPRVWGILGSGPTPHFGQDPCQKWSHISTLGPQYRQARHQTPCISAYTSVGAQKLHPKGPRRRI